MAPTIGVNLRVTGHCNQGSRGHMEDMFSVAYQQTEDELDLEYAYFGIFDGHGGHEAATFAKEHLMKAIVSQPGFWSDSDKDVLRAIKDGFIATHYAMWRNLENWPKTQSGWPSTSGTTASIAFIRRSNIYIGHVGDSCIVLGHQDPSSDHWKGTALTQDHKPENPTEYKRISQAGGMVVQKSGVPRVVWHRPRLSHKGPLTRSTHIDLIPFLAVARSLGDLWSYNADSDCFVVSPEPDVSVHQIDLARDRCLIFGTDGLWNMLTPDEAVGIVRKAECNNKSNGGGDQEQVWLNPSKCLVDNALNKWMTFELRADNTSAVTLLLDPLRPPHSQVLNQQNAVSNIGSEFVPYHIESYKVNDIKSSTKSHNQTSGLAICTWHPQKSLNEGFKGCETTTLTAMEELFGKKVEIFDCKKKDIVLNECKTEQSIKAVASAIEVFSPTTSKTLLAKESESKKLPSQYCTKLRNLDRSAEIIKKEIVNNEKKQMPKIFVTVEDDVENIRKEHSTFENRDENDNQKMNEKLNKMKLRGSPPVKVDQAIRSDQRLSNDGTLTKNYQKNSFRMNTLKRSNKRGKKRKNYEVLESQTNSKADSKSLRSKNKRRHSSLYETMNLVYEPRFKRRTRSEDQKKGFEKEEYRSDTENKSDEEITNLKKVTRVKTHSGGGGKSTGPNDETLKQNHHLQERLQTNHGNSNSQNNFLNETRGNGKNGNGSGHVQTVSAGSGNNVIGDGGCFTPMRLRSNVPVKTLRSRNINLEICDWFFLGLNKYNNVNGQRKSLTKQQQQQQQQPPQNFKTEESCENNTKNLPKINFLTRNSINSMKFQVTDSPYRSAVHTRSQNKRFKK